MGSVGDSLSARRLVAQGSLRRLAPILAILLAALSSTGCNSGADSNGAKRTMDAKTAERMATGRRLFEEAERDPGLIQGHAALGASVDCPLMAANQPSSRTAIIVNRSRENGLEGRITVLTGKASFNFAAGFLQSDDLQREIYVLHGSPLRSGDKSVSFGIAEARTVADLIQALREQCARTATGPKTFLLVKDAPDPDRTTY